MQRRKQVQQKRKQAVYKSKALVSTVNKIVNKKLDKVVEKKYVDFDRTAVGEAMNWATSIRCLSDISQGDGDTNRDGDKVKLLSYEVNGYVFCNANSPTLVRMTVIRFNDADDILSAYGGPKVLGDLVYQASTGTSAIPMSSFNFDRLRSGQFTILKDKKTWLQSTTSASELVRKISLRGKIKSSIDFLAGTNRGKGHIYLILSSGNASGAGNPIFYYYTRVKYIDA